jgi:hypothetical protein
MPGWRRSADRTRLQANSLLTGNLTGNFAISGPEDRISEQETAVLQRFLSQFPTKLNRENIWENRELKNQEQGINLQKGQTPSGQKSSNSKPQFCSVKAKAGQSGLHDLLRVYALTWPLGCTRRHH